MLALSKVNTRKLLTIIHMAIFFSIFAISASIISIYFENRIDKLESKIIEEETIKRTKAKEKKATDKASGNQKLKDLGLTDDEIAALIG